MWKGKLLSNVLAGCGDPDDGVWSAWLAEAFSPVASVDGELPNLVLGVEHLYKLAYPETGRWESNDGQRSLPEKQPESVPQEEELRDTPYRKLKGDLKELELDLKLYEHMERGDPAETHKCLLNMIDPPVKGNALPARKLQEVRKSPEKTPHA